MTLPTVVQRATPMPLYRASAADVRVGPGFYDEERDSTGSFWWMGATGHLHFDPAPVDRWLAFRALSEFKDLSQSLSVQTAAGEQAAAFRLVSGWNPLSVPVPAGASAVTLSGRLVNCRPMWKSSK